MAKYIDAAKSLIEPFNTGIEPYAAKKPEFYIKLKTSAKIPDVIKIFEKMKPSELNYDEKTNTFIFGLIK